MADKTINTRLILRNDDLSNWLSSSRELYKGEAALARLSGELSDKFEIRIGVGGKTWNQLSSSNFLIPATNVIGLEGQLSSVQPNFYSVAVSTDLPTGATVPYGSIGVVSSEIGTGTGKISRTAYWWNKKESRWEALDGNYSADNVYFAEDITLAGSYLSVGNVTKSALTATGTLDAAGKSVKDLFQSIFTKELSGYVSSNPYASGATLKAKVNGAGNLVTASQSYEYGTYLTDIEFSGGTFNKGSYYYGPTSQQTAASWATTTTNSVAIKTGAASNTGTLESIVIGDEGKDTDNAVLSAYTTVKSVKVTETATYAADTVEANTNLGNTNTSKGFETIRIPAGTKSSNSGEFSGYRYYFWGYRLADEGAFDITSLTSDNIREGIQHNSYRDLANRATRGTSFPATDATTKATNFSVPKNTKQIIFACPHDVHKKKIAAYNNSSLGAVLDFDNKNLRKESIVSVNGANGYTAIKYDVWYITFGAVLAVDTNLAITWVNE